MSGTRNGLVGDGGRYSKEDMLSIYASQKELGLLGANLSRIFAGPWDLDAFETVSSNTKDPGPEVCWNPEPVLEPLGMRDMDDIERQVWTHNWLAQTLLTCYSSSQPLSIHRSSSTIPKSPLPLPQAAERHPSPK